VKGVRKFLDDLEENLLLLLLSVSVVVIFMQVVMRYVFQSSLSWSEELGRYIFIWFTWLGTGYAVRRRRHLRIEIMSDLFGERGRLVLEILAMIVWCAFSVFLVDKGFVITAMVWRRGQLTAAMEIPTALAYAAIPVGSALMALRLVDEIIRSVRRLMGAR
jgi:TRAP-type C4-dicarboxylate transport system permease small subunit